MNDKEFNECLDKIKDNMNLGADIKATIDLPLENMSLAITVLSLLKDLRQDQFIDVISFIEDLKERDKDGN